MRIDEVMGDRVQKLLLDNLGSQEEQIECSSNSAHGHRQVDVGMLLHGRVQYQPCLKCMARDRTIGQGVPPELAEVTRKGYAISCSAQQHAFNTWSRWLENHLKQEGEKTFLLMLGTVGTGKSHMAVVAFKALGGGWYTTPAKLFSTINDRMKDEKIKDPVAKAKKARVLVLDEFCVGGSRSDAPEVWNEIFHYRYGRKKPTIIVSNADAEHLVETIGLEGIRDRFRSDGELLTFNWASHRTGKGSHA